MYSITGPRRVLGKRFHQAPFVILDPLNPIRLSRGDQSMCAEFLDMPIKRLDLVNLDFGIFHGTIGAVLTTIGPIFLWLDGGKDVLRRSSATKRQQ